MQFSQLALSSGWIKGAIDILVELRTITEPQDREAEANTWAELLLKLSDLARRTGNLILADETLKEAEQLMPSWRISAKRGHIALLSNNESLTSTLLQNALVGAKQARATGTFTKSETEAYAHLLFDLAAFSAGNQDWNTALAYLIDDWTLDPDPTLILPAYLVLKEEDTADDMAARKWLEYVTDTINASDLSKEDRKKFALVFLSLARVQKTAGDLQEADRSYTQSLRQDPQPDTVLESAYLALQLNAPSRALSLVETLDQPQHVDAVTAIRCEAYRALGRSDEAFACVLAEVEGQPDNAEGYLNLGNLYLQRDDDEKAIKALLQSYKLSPSLAAANQLGFLYQEQGDDQAAHHWFAISYKEYNDQTAGMGLLYIALEQENFDEAARLLGALNVSTLTREQMAGYHAARAQVTLYQATSHPRRWKVHWPICSRQDR